MTAGVAGPAIRISFIPGDEIAGGVIHDVLVGLKTFCKTGIHQAERAEGAQRIAGLNDADAMNRVLWLLSSITSALTLLAAQCHREREPPDAATDDQNAFEGFIPPSFRLQGRFIPQ